MHVSAATAAAAAIVTYVSQLARAERAIVPAPHTPPPLPQIISPPHRCAPRLKALFYALQRWPTTAIARSTRRITGSTILIAGAGRRAALHHHALAAAGALGVFWHEPPADARVTSLQSRAQEWDAMRKRVVISHDTDECRSSDARAAGGDVASAADTCVGSGVSRDVRVTSVAYASVDAGYDDNGGSGGGHDDEDCNNYDSVVFEDVL